MNSLDNLKFRVSNIHSVTNNTHMGLVREFSYSLLESSSSVIPDSEEAHPEQAAIAKAKQAFKFTVA